MEEVKEVGGKGVGEKVFTINNVGAPRVQVKPLESRLPVPPQPRFPEPPAPLPLPKVKAPQLSAEAPLAELDPLTLMLGNALFRRSSGNPVFMIAVKPNNRRYEYIEFLKRILREIYMVSARSPLNVQHVAKRLTEYQLALLRSGSSIYVLDIDSIADSEAGAASIGKLASFLEDRLREAFGQGFGFLVFYTSREYVSRIKSIWQAEVSGRGALYASLPQPVIVSISEDDAAFQLVGLLYGTSTVDGATSIDTAAIAAEARLSECLEAAANDSVAARYVRHAVDDEEARAEEAFLHYALKSLVVEYLLEAGYRGSSIDTEVVVANTTVDVFIRRGWAGGVIVEVETLHGSLNPAARLNSVLKSRLSTGYETWIVLHPLTASIYKPVIAPLMRDYGSYGSVRFMTLDSDTCTLMDLEKHYERIEKAAERLIGERGGFHVFQTFHTSAGGL